MKTRFASENMTLQFMQSMQIAKKNLTCVNGTDFHTNLLSPLWRNMWIVGNAPRIVCYEAVPEKDMAGYSKYLKEHALPPAEIKLYPESPELGKLAGFILVDGGLLLHMTQRTEEEWQALRRDSYPYMDDEEFATLRDNNSFMVPEVTDDAGEIAQAQAIVEALERISEKPIVGCGVAVDLQEENKNE